MPLLTNQVNNIWIHSYIPYTVLSPFLDRSVFEELVSSYPKRTDLWHVYVDKEIKCGMHDRARQVIDRLNDWLTDWLLHYYPCRVNDALLSLSINTLINPRHNLVAPSHNSLFNVVMTVVRAHDCLHRYEPSQRQGRVQKIHGFRTGETICWSIYFPIYTSVLSCIPANSSTPNNCPQQQLLCLLS